MPKSPLSREDAATLHLHLWLTALNRTMRAALASQCSRIDRLRRDPPPPGCLSPKQACALLDGIETRVRDGARGLPALELTRRETEAELDLIRSSPVAPPLVRLRRDAGLDAFEQCALIIAVAPEISNDYRRLFGYILDDLARDHASVELILALTSSPGSRDGQRRRKLGPGGALRRLGLIVAADPLSTPLSLRLEPAPGLVDWLLGTTAAPPVPLSDPQLLQTSVPTRAHSSETLRAAFTCLATSANAVVGIWGRDPNRHDDVVIELAGHLGLPVYRARATGQFVDWSAQIRQEAAIAAGADAVLWIETRHLPSLASHGPAIAQELARLTQRMIITGRIAWRAPELIGSRPYADLTLPAAAAVSDDWAVSSDVLPASTAAALSARFRLGWRERRAALQLALSDQRNRANGSVPDFPEALERACQLVASPGHMSSVSVVEPQRCLDELILPEDLHRQIAEIGQLYSHTRHVDAEWGFGRLTGSSGALKALFTGDPGTGKTMAAEVIAGEAGVPLMKVDLSQVVSKWVGETEKNLEGVFDHAEQNNAALFFDEADALFGKRGEVRHGTDRYANLEVSYLLQRLETFSGGLIILASNVRDAIDPAFSRRFQVALHFPRPGRNERLRLWELAFAAAPLSGSVDLADMAELDLTGGAIVTAARMAALLAAADGAKQIEQSHVAAATERQFRKEARLMAAARPDGLSVARARG